MRLRAIGALLMLMVSAAACSEDKAPTEPTPVPEQPDTTAVFTIQSPAPPPDTIQTRAAMTVRLTTASGQPRPNSQVIFTVVPDANGVANDVRISTSADSDPRTQIVTATDINGFAQVEVRYGGTLGSARVRAVSVPYQAVVFSTYVTARAGNLASVDITPTIKLINVGDSLVLTVTPKDRLGHVLQQATTFETSGTIISVASNGVVKGLTSGVQSVRAVATAGNVTVKSVDATISVAAIPPPGPTPPAAQFAWLFVPQSVSGPFVFSSELVTGNLGSSDFTVIVANGAGAPAWQPHTSRLAYQLGSNIVVHDVATGAKSFIPTSSLESWPQFSDDGNWVYFTQYDAGIPHIYRAHPDGSGKEGLVTDESAQMATPSPDGTSFAYVANTTTLKIVDMTSNGSRHAIASAAPALLTPRWSPDGKAIAYIGAQNSSSPNGVLWLVNASTGSANVIGNSVWQAGISWSGDSQWIAGFTNSGALQGGLIFVQSGVLVRAAIGVAPAWRY